MADTNTTISSQRVEQLNVEIISKQGANAQQRKPDETAVRDLRRNIGNMLNEFAEANDVESIKGTFTIEDN